MGRCGVLCKMVIYAGHAVRVFGLAQISAEQHNWGATIDQYCMSGMGFPYLGSP